MKRFVIFFLLSLISLGSFAKADGYFQEDDHTEEKLSAEILFAKMPMQRESFKVYDLEYEMNRAKIWEVADYTLGSILVAIGAAAITDLLINGNYDNSTTDEGGAGYDFLYITGATLVGLASIPFFVKANKLHMKHKSLKLQLEPMMSRDLMGTVNVSPGVGFKVNF